MASKPGQKKISVFMQPDVLDQLAIAAIKIKDHVPRERAMERGPMVGYLCRWFIELDRELQLRVILAGKALEEGDAWAGAEELARAVGAETGRLRRKAAAMGVEDDDAGREPEKAAPASASRNKGLGVSDLGDPRRNTPRSANGDQKATAKRRGKPR